MHRIKLCVIGQLARTEETRLKSLSLKTFFACSFKLGLNFTLKVRLYIKGSVFNSFTKLLSPDVLLSNFFWEEGEH